MVPPSIHLTLVIGIFSVPVKLAYDLTCVSLIMSFSAIFFTFLFRTSLNFFVPLILFCMKFSRLLPYASCVWNFLFAIFQPIFKLLNILGITADSSLADIVLRFCSSPFSVINCQVTFLMVSVSSTWSLLKKKFHQNDFLPFAHIQINCS